MIFNTKQKMKHFISMIIFMTVMAIPAFAGVLESVTAALKHHSASELAAFFDSSVDLTILNNESNYSKKQAEVIIQRFFNDNGASGFTLTHQGKSPDGSMYGTGNLTTAKGTFKVYFFLKKSSTGSVIQELRFEN